MRTQGTATTDVRLRGTDPFPSIDTNLYLSEQSESVSFSMKACEQEALFPERLLQLSSGNRDR